MTRVARTVALAWRAGRPSLIAYVLLAPATGALPVLVAWLTKVVLDRVVDPSAGAVAGPAAALAVAAVGTAVLPHLSGYLRAQVGRRTAMVALGDLYTATDRLTGLRRLEEPAFQNTLRLAEQAGRDAPARSASTLSLIHI